MAKEIDYIEEVTPQLTRVAAPTGYRFTKITSKTGVLTEIGNIDAVKYQIWAGEIEPAGRGIVSFRLIGKRPNKDLEDELMKIST